MQTNEIRRKLVILIAEMKQMPEFDGAISLIESGLLDSFDLMLLAANISERFGVELIGDEFVPENFENVDTLSAAIGRKMVR